MIGKALGATWSFLSNIISVALDAIGGFFGWLFDGLIAVLTTIFRPIFILIAIILYVLYKISSIFLLLAKILLGIGKLLYKFVIGFLSTIKSLIWTPSPPDHGAWSQPIREAIDGLSYYQLDKIAYVLLFAIWFLTAYAAIKLISGGGR